MVIRGDPANPHGSTAKTAVHDDFFAIAARCEPDRFHERPAFAAPIARHAEIDVARIEAERTVVAMPAATDGRPDECPAMPAFERFLPFRHLARVVMRRGTIARGFFVLVLFS